jgi:hypothetical protein
MFASAAGQKWAKNTHGGVAAFNRLLQEYRHDQ